MKITIVVKKNAAAQRMAHTVWTQTKLSRNVTLPALRDIADVLISDMKQEFSGARRYTGDMASGFDQHDINQSSVGITQSSAHEMFVRRGTTGPYKGFPTPVIAWAMFHGHTRDEAGAIAKRIQMQGTAAFEYPEWVINKHAHDIPAWARKIGQGAVSYITAGDTWKARQIG